MEGNDEDKNKSASAIIEMLKEAGVSTDGLEQKEHKFWDTQVGDDCSAWYCSECSKHMKYSNDNK